VKVYGTPAFANVQSEYVTASQRDTISDERLPIAKIRRSTSFPRRWPDTRVPITNKAFEQRWARRREADKWGSAEFSLSNSAVLPSRETATLSRRGAPEQTNAARGTTGRSDSGRILPGMRLGRASETTPECFRKHMGNKKYNRAIADWDVPCRVLPAAPIGTCARDEGAGRG
jgi:hypothetical protein